VNLLNKLKDIMTKNKMKWFSATLIVFVMLSFTACLHSQAQRRSGNEAATSNKSVKAKPASSNPKIRLNSENIGTIRNLSILSNKLKRIFREREKNATFRENTSEVEKTVFVDPEPSLKVIEVAKVLTVLEDSGASPLMLSFETIEELPSLIDWKNSANGVGNSTFIPPKPNPLTLVVTIGNSETEILAEKGIVLRLLQTTIPRKESYGLDGLVVDIGKEDEYLINDKPVEKTALENAFKAFLRDAPGEDSKYIIVNLENNADKISFGSVLGVAREAHKAGIKEVELRIYFPPL
jgi:biopolymer transport protein ExbD